MCEESFCTSLTNVRPAVPSVGYAQCRPCRILLGPFEQLLREYPTARDFEPLPAAPEQTGLEAAPEELGLDEVERVAA